MKHSKHEHQYLNKYEIMASPMFINNFSVSDLNFSCVSLAFRIIGLYVSIVFAVSRIIHGYVEELPSLLIFDEILCPDVLWQLLEDIYLVRSRRKFDLEELLVGRLFAVIRSPESIIQLTEYEKPKRD